MAKKVKKTRPELKRFRDVLTRYERYLPMLKLKQQQLQVSMRQIDKDRREAEADIQTANEKFEPYKIILKDTAGVNLPTLAEVDEIKTSSTNIAGVNIPVFEEVTFTDVRYSLFATPAWVDSALLDMRQINRCRARVEVIDEQYRLIKKELTKIVQRVNLFEKVKIPEAREIIRVIRIHLGDEMTAAVGRAKIAKGKLTKTDTASADRHDLENQTEEVPA